MKEFLIKRVRTEPSSNPRASTGSLQVDEEGIIRAADDTAEALFGYGILQMQGLPMVDLVASREDNPLAPPLNDRLETGESALITALHATGYFFTINIRRSLTETDTATSQTAQIRPRQGTPLDTRILRLAEDSAGLGIWEMDPDSNRIYWSEGVFHLLDLPPGNQLDPEHVLFYFQEHQARVRRAFLSCLRRGEAFSMEVPVLTARQNQRWLRLTGHSLNDGQRSRVICGTAVDITARRADAHSAQTWKYRTQSVLAASDDLIVIMNPELEIVAVNRAYSDAFEAVFGITPNVGDQLQDLLEDHPDERRLYNRLWERAMGQEGFCVEMPLIQSDEKLPVYEIQFNRIFSPDGELLGAAHVGRSKSAPHSEAQEHVHYLNSHDPLTGLLNRRELLQRLSRALNVVRESGTPHSLAYMDLDGFSTLNARFGSGGCDRYLRALSSMLINRLRQRDTIARVASDQFVIILDNCGTDEATKVCHSLRDAVAEFEFDWRGATVQTTISGGLLPLHLEQDASPEHCLSLAADLCETAKTTGPASLSLYRPRAGIDDETATREELAQLMHAITTDAIELHFQALRPIASATWGDHVEVLSRLHREPRDDGGSYSELWRPAAFMPLAERYDLGYALDRRVIARAIEWLEANPLMQPRLKMISFNLSASSMLDEGFAREIASQIQSSSFDASSYCFEIREAHACDYPEAAKHCCNVLREIGCRIALDGAGVRGQSHRLIGELGASIVKIDETLMQGLASNPLQVVMVEALHRMATLSDAVTVAPFIEDEATLKKVRELGLHFGQGYRLTQPELLNELAPPEKTATGRTGVAGR
ncbi:diguanylate cyclase (GGDEF)-like protein [Halospina denitrificans]|uniref:Diguanylate cyclase (GGDEF)-like protein n=1 Tax=Halospina denitrificans TaxID=332522 RepID=A0A4R7K1K2_9GAMM|nr:EAL domain-containing protein [Halospina denitrificans]TDT44326.1 diguanylate cyclase (GGDEF)-like protein [Halospina denitrificans]